MKPEDRQQWLAFGIGMTASVMLVIGTLSILGNSALQHAAVPVLIGVHLVIGLLLGLVRPSYVLAASVGVAALWCLQAVRAVVQHPLGAIGFVQAVVWSSATMAGGAVAWLATRAWRSLRQRGA